jgi:hypothetical protein
MKEREREREKYINGHWCGGDVKREFERNDHHLVHMLRTNVLLRGAP